MKKSFEYILLEMYKDVEEKINDGDILSGSGYPKRSVEIIHQKAGALAMVKEVLTRISELTQDNPAN